jgi:hypothetical protein
MGSPSACRGLGEAAANTYEVGREREQRREEVVENCFELVCFQEKKS